MANTYDRHTAKFLAKVSENMPPELSGDVMQGWIENPKALQKALREALCPPADTSKKGQFTSYPITVDYGTKVEDAAEFSKYDWVSGNITQKNFPTERKGKAELTLQLVHLNRNISSDEALKKLDRTGYRPAELHELLAFGEKYPEVQRGFPIVALGSVWKNPDGRSCVSYLSGSGFGRFLSLVWFKDDWSGVWRFAAVRK